MEVSIENIRTSIIQLAWRHLLLFPLCFDKGKNARAECSTSLCAVIHGQTLLFAEEIKEGRESVVQQKDCSQLTLYKEL